MWIHSAAIRLQIAESVSGVWFCTYDETVTACHLNEIFPTVAWIMKQMVYKQDTHTVHLNYTQEFLKLCAFFFEDLAPKPRRTFRDHKVNIWWHSIIVWPWYRSRHHGLCNLILYAHDLICYTLYMTSSLFGRKGWKKVYWIYWIYFQSPHRKIVHPCRNVRIPRLKTMSSLHLGSCGHNGQIQIFSLFHCLLLNKILRTR